MKRTPLFESHVALGARIVPFAGWEMPVWYGGITQEHNAVRTRAGLFDVSHMGEFTIRGPDALANLRRLLTNDAGLLTDGQAQYSLLLNERGGTVDDLLVYRLEPDAYMLVVNAANIDKDWAWLEDHVNGEATLEDRSDETALVAIQGPKSADILTRAAGLSAASIPYYHFDRRRVAGVEALVSRTGYTGEDGFEVMVASVDGMAVWSALLSAGADEGIEPAGLGARDSLRIEASMPLYGHELDDDTSALEAGLGFFVKLDKPELLGGERLAREKAEGVTRRLVGFEMLDRGVPRQGYELRSNGVAVGVVTSGLMSPTLGRAIGMGFVAPEHAAVDAPLTVGIRGREVPARVVKRPFYRRPKGA